MTKPNYYGIDFRGEDFTHIWAVFEIPTSKTGKYILPSLDVTKEDDNAFYFHDATGFPFGASLDTTNEESFAHPMKYSFGAIGYNPSKPYKTNDIMSACYEFLKEHNIEGKAITIG